MCIPKVEVLAIYGRSCTGKSTVARIVADWWKTPLRLCGEIVRGMAKELMVDIDCVPRNRHRQIDAETVDWCSREGGLCVVEGRFLDQVLGPTTPALYLVLFEATVRSRADRWEARKGRFHTVRDLEAMDAADDAFRMNTYHNRARLAPNLTIDTTSSTPEEIARCLTRRIHPEQIVRD